nr:MAG TPA: hypothetical protein [Bacteriophage sp.]DAR18243.1 MAG TPA: hypothetical protein [Bacteriophage sp.]
MIGYTRERKKRRTPTHAYTLWTGSEDSRPWQWSHTITREVPSANYCQAPNSSPYSSFSADLYFPSFRYASESTHTTGLATSCVASPDSPSPPAR